MSPLERQPEEHDRPSPEEIEHHIIVEFSRRFKQRFTDLLSKTVMAKILGATIASDVIFYLNDIESFPFATSVTMAVMAISRIHASKLFARAQEQNKNNARVFPDAFEALLQKHCHWLSDLEHDDEFDRKIREIYEEMHSDYFGDKGKS